MVESPLQVDAFGRCLYCGQDCGTGGCVNPRCPRIQIEAWRNILPSGTHIAIDQKGCLTISTKFPVKQLDGDILHPYGRCVCESKGFCYCCKVQAIEQAAASLQQNPFREDLAKFFNTVREILDRKLY